MTGGTMTTADPLAVTMTATTAATTAPPRLDTVQPRPLPVAEGGAIASTPRPALAAHARLQTRVRVARR